MRNETDVRAHTEVSGPRGRDETPTTVVDLLARRAAERPDVAAVLTDREQLTSAELWTRSAALGRQLQVLGVSADDCVGVYAEPSAELMIGVWGVLAAGGAYLPLSPEYPRDRVRHMIIDAGVEVVVTQAELADQVRSVVPGRVRVVVAGAEADRLGDRGTRPARTVEPGGSLAYVIFTSGSTGLPKGVMVEHRSILSQMLWLQARMGIGEGERILAKTPFSFDAAQWEILAPALGATVVLPPPGAYREPDRIVDAVVEHGVTVLQCVPTLWTALADGGRLVECTSLRRTFSGGEVLTKGLATALVRALPQATLTNLYGPTETTINATYTEVTEMVLQSSGSTVSIGDPVSGTELHILGADLRPVVEGQTGELCIGGIQVARGYLNNEELTRKRFLEWRCPEGAPRRVYRTGDLARWSSNGELVFIGRADNQVKINGYRIEPDEVRVAIEGHHWVRQACVVPWTSPRTGATQLAAFVELDPREASLMDQGAHGAHHESKQSRVQVRAQLSRRGLRDDAELSGRLSLALPAQQADDQQVRAAFARKTYRFFEGGETTRPDLLSWLDSSVGAREAAAASPNPLDLRSLGQILRWFGPFTSPERLLPKYGYASPGALNATQIYLEVAGGGPVAPGLYYFHPVEHRLVLVAPRSGAEPRPVRVHFVGKRAAIEAVYATNVREVLAIEAGHMIGLLDGVLPQHGRGVRRLHQRDALDVDELGVASEHYYLAGVELVDAADRDQPASTDVGVYLQSHRGEVVGLPDGLYQYRSGDLVPVGDDIVRGRDVIAINQEVYSRAAFGITLTCPQAAGWPGFVSLGRMLQLLETNEHSIGLMSSGYSSLTGRDLPSARRFASILTAAGAEQALLTYFAVGGRVSAGQQESRGMNEDVVHMRGPAEILKDDLKGFLPQYMLPARVDIVASLPKTSNGKCDATALAELAAVKDAERIQVAPRTAAEERITRLWKDLLGIDDVSVTDDFFASGGNSLTGVSLINEVNADFGVELPLQILFHASTPEQLATVVTEQSSRKQSRLVALQSKGAGRPIFAWPGLGGFPMNLRELGSALGTSRPFYGVQAHGINAGETPFRTIEDMARADVAMILERQPSGPYTLLGYSFGARVAYETAYRLEEAGHEVDRLVLIAPGSPLSADQPVPADADRADFHNPYFVQILLSVFSGSLDSPLLRPCQQRATDEAAFCAFVNENFPQLPPDLIRRIVAVVRQSFTFKYSFSELNERTVAAPMSILKAQGDDYSFIEGKEGFALRAPTVVDLQHDHYSILHGRIATELATHIRSQLNATTETGITVPHINIKHYPVQLSEEELDRLVDELTSTVAKIFGCREGAVSIALEPVAESDWANGVYQPELIARRELLCKTPDYLAA